jgi:hypothetical protein
MKMEICLGSVLRMVFWFLSQKMAPTGQASATSLQQPKPSTSVNTA